MPKPLSADIKNDIKSAQLAGKVPMDVANRLGLRMQRLITMRSSFSLTDSVDLVVVQGQLKTARKVHDKLMELGYSISYKTAINVLKSMNFFSAIKVKKPLLTAKHMKRRLAWAKKYQNWTTDDWRRVVFSDETKVNIWGSDGCKYYWSRPGDPLKPHHIDACQIYDGTMNSDLYQHILDTTLRETMEYYDMDWSTAYFQHDGDPKHRSKSPSNG
ncbi:hypothetical protein G6F26_012637 [Rhizopus arrhizus]|nr:hypothetical protein G6F26_012637 [Rhizopus arrhizus]